ncbi:hypothetical protein ES705_14732 [subsurface metagenome]
MTEEEETTEKEKSQYKLEYKRFQEWAITVDLIDQNEIKNLLLYKINENLTLITKSILVKDLKF